MTGLSQAAAQLGCSVETIRRRIKSGEITATKVAGSWDIDLPVEATEKPSDGHSGADARVVELLEAQVLELHQDKEELRQQISQLHTEIMQLHQLLGQKQLEAASSRRWWRIWGR